MNSKNGTTQSNEGPHSQQSSGQVRICLSVNAYKQNVSKLNTIQDTGPIKIILDHHSQLGLTHLGCFITTHWFVFVSTGFLVPYTGTMYKYLQCNGGVPGMLATTLLVSGSYIYSDLVDAWADSCLHPPDRTLALLQGFP